MAVHGEYDSAVDVQPRCSGGMYLPPYFFPPQHIIFQKILCVRHVRNTICFEKIMCCGKFVTTHYYLSHNVIFFKKNIVLWQVWHNTYYFLSHNTLFFKRYCVVRHVRNTIFFEK